MRRHNVRVKFFEWYQAHLRTTYHDVQIDELEIFEFRLINLPYQHFIKLFVLFKYCSLEVIYHGHVIITNDGANQNADDLRLLHFFNIGVSFHYDFCMVLIRLDGAERSHM